MANTEFFQVMGEPGREQFVVVYHDIAYATDIDPVAKMVYIVLKTFVDYKGECYPTISTLAKRVNTSETSVKRKLNQLEELGYISKEQRTNGNNKTISNLYTLKNPTLEKAKKNAIAPTDQSKEQPQNMESLNDTTTKVMQSRNESSCANSSTVERETQYQIGTNGKKTSDSLHEKAAEIVENQLTQAELRSVIKAANNDLEKIRSKYEMAKKQFGSIKTLGAWLVSAIKTDYQAAIGTKKEPNTSGQASGNKFNAFPQRQYTGEDFASLERRKLDKQFETLLGV